MHTFTEIQRFRQWWLWMIIGASALIAFGILLVDGFQLFDLAPLSIPLLVAVFMYIMRLDTRIDQIGIRYRFFPLTGWRSIPWSRIEQAGVHPYQFVGYGIRWNGDGWYYNIDGTWGLHIDRVSGKRLVIGTQQPDELREFLRSFHPQNQE